MFWTKRILVAAMLLSAALHAAAAASVDLVLNPSPQAAGNTCQSYSLALALAFAPAYPTGPKTAQELRDLERRIRTELVKSAAGGTIDRTDWKVAVEAATGGKLTVASRQFADLDAALRFVALQTGIDHADQLPTAISAALVRIPVLMSFTRIGTSKYPEGHIVTVFGVVSPPASITNQARPKLLMVNSAVKYPGGVKNICAEEDLSDADHYRATVALTGDYDPKLFGSKPYLVSYVAAP